MNLTKLVKEVIEISKKAGLEIIKIYNTQNFAVQYKNDDSPLTIADETSNALIVHELSQLTPHIPVISEEGIHLPYAERQHFDYFWLVDPLDGTKEFVARNGEFAVNIALVHRFQPVLGVVYVPYTEGVYFAVKNEGAFKIQKGQQYKLTCSSFNSHDSGLRIPVSRSYLNDTTKKLIAQNFIDPILIERGSALKFLDIAEGVADIYPRIGTTMEWDTAAPQIIIEEAGGQLLHLDTRQPLVYNKKSLKNPDFLALGVILGDGANFLK